VRIIPTTEVYPVIYSQIAILLEIIKKATLNNLNQMATMDATAAPAFVFFLAGFERTSATMTFCLYELARNPDIQERARNEINTVLNNHGGNITYEAISKMEYLYKFVSGD